MAKVKVTDKMEFPEGFSEEAKAVFMMIHESMKGTTEAAKAHGIADDQLISAIMSATITELVKLRGCPHCAAVVLGEASITLLEAFDGAKEDERVH